MSLAIHLLEHAHLLVILCVFFFAAIPAGWAAMAGFFAIIGTFFRGKEADKAGEVTVGKISFKGPIRLGLIAIAIIFAIIAYRNSDDAKGRRDVSNGESSFVQSGSRVPYSRADAAYFSDSLGRSQRYR